MSQHPDIPKDFQENVIRLLDGNMTDEEFALFNETLSSNPSWAPHYLNALADYMAITKMGHVLPVPQDAQHRVPYSAQDLIRLLDLETTLPEPLAQFKFEPNIPEEERKRRIEIYAKEQLESFLRQQHPPVSTSRMPNPSWSLDRWLDQGIANTVKTIQTGLRFLKFATVAGIAALFLGFVGLVAYSNRTVAQVVETVEARWSSPLSDQAKLRPRRLRLEEGFARIRLNRGSEIILQAPTTIELKNSNKIHLENGWLTAQVPLQAHGFTVETPWSKVVDYGTEFGLITGNEFDTQVHVLKGDVGLQSSSGANPTMQHLLAGQGASQDRRGRTTLSNLTGHTRLFVRELPSNTELGFPGKRLNLADIVGGGNGFGTGLPGQGLNPSTGQIAITPQVLNAPSKGFISTNASIFVDGVFIPDASLGTQIISSTGLDFEGCPDTSGLCLETIRYGASQHVSPFQFAPVQLGNDVQDPNHPCIGIHANAGITFDLGKIRSAMSDVSLSHFSTYCGFPSHETSYPVKVWVLIDGQAQFAQELSADSTAEPHEIRVKLQSSQRFLTLAVTTTTQYDQTSMAIFDQPILTLSN